MDSLIKKCKEILDLVKAIKIPGMPSSVLPKIKKPSLAPPSAKNPVNVAQQLNTPQMRDLAMKRSIEIDKANKNQLAFKSEDPNMDGIKPYKPSFDDEPHFHIIKDGQRVTTDPVPLSVINRKWGGVKAVEGSGHVLVPVKKEKLTFAKNGQWTLN